MTEKTVTLPSASWDVILAAEPTDRERYTPEGIALSNAFQGLRAALPAPVSPSPDIEPNAYQAGSLVNDQPSSLNRPVGYGGGEELEAEVERLREARDILAPNDGPPPDESVEAGEKKRNHDNLAVSPDEERKARLSGTVCPSCGHVFGGLEE